MTTESCSEILPPCGKKQTCSKPSLSRMFGYALGDGALSITMNGISNFAMLYYTQLLGLSASWAGIALSITLFWDAVTDPIMGHISDRTRSRFGNRHPYILIGGVLLAVFFFLLWVVPDWFDQPVAVFAAVLAINLLVRTAVTVYLVPYTALGFEMCQDYDDRSRLQGIRSFINQATNLVFGAFAWTLFFRDSSGPDGERIDGTLIKENYLSMGAVLAAATFVFIILSVLATRPYIEDNRAQRAEGRALQAFVVGIARIGRNRLSWLVVGFFALAQLAMLLTAQMQMFTYVFFMEFSASEKTAVHGGGMVAFSMGALAVSRLVGRFDKKMTGYIGMLLASIGSLGLLAVFTTGWMSPQASARIHGFTLPIGTGVFGIGQALWWGGCGILVPLATSMIADVSSLDQRETGINRDGTFAAAFSFFQKAAASFGLLITGFLVDLAGIVSDAKAQAPEAAFNIAALTFMGGPILMAISFLVLRMYPITREWMPRKAS